MRNPERLEVYALARTLAVEVYRVAADLPDTERYNLREQLRRSAVSVVANIAEGCGRSGRGEYEHFLNIALGSAVEVGSLLDLSCDLGFASFDRTRRCRTCQQHLVRALHKLHSSIRYLEP
ncbi:MAG: four helix bundle protein [Vicinamibacteraceae bacterium]|nr:four helix bundle protein [Vicinamibacteraceae bacterium]